jgi:hypothetical protein
MMIVVRLAIAAIAFVLASPAWAHGGGLNAQGCHNNRKTGDYHCHESRGGLSREPTVRLPRMRVLSAPVSRGPVDVVDRSIASVDCPGDLVQAIQRALIDRGYDLAETDNRMGPKTQSAIMSFQQASGLAVDGLPTVALLDQLRAAPLSAEVVAPQ